MLKLRELKAQQEKKENKDKETTDQNTEEGKTKTEGETEQFSLKRQNSKELAESRKKKSTESVFSLGKGRGGRRNRVKTNAAELRAQKDLNELDLSATPGVEPKFPDENNIMNFNVFVTPTDGLYKGATFEFNLIVPTSYPYDPPKAVCKTLVYHPNIDFQGAVCLNILRADWKPVLTLGSVFFGLMTLFLEPNPDDPLNKEAAELMINKRSEFEANVKKSLRGGYMFNKQFPKLL
eukprot:TRINITY_DN715_c0_g1_i1.p1 TRINITY_DN715_c0_g1~~TRINITY_DN715_c0_g1_i1.p1  ORF type:complete len:236 (+),score=59.02 TRINITY_DN715_c0_g1_i1:83-790(+)